LGREAFLLALLAIIAGGVAACGPFAGSQTTGTTVRNQASHFDITVTDAAGQRHASINCIGTVTGSGYLADARAAGSACVTAGVSSPVADFLRPRDGEDDEDPRSDCNLYIAAWRSAKLPAAPQGQATITGVERGKPISRQLDPTSGECDRALWELMQPLFVPSENELVVNYPEQ
jgi:hypothetical protein